jgi:hypothetical protein
MRSNSLANRGFRSDLGDRSSARECSVIFGRDRYEKNPDHDARGWLARRIDKVGLGLWPAARLPRNYMHPAMREGINTARKEFRWSKALWQTHPRAAPACTGAPLGPRV